MREDSLVSAAVATRSGVLQSLIFYLVLSWLAFCFALVLKTSFLVCVCFRLVALHARKAHSGVTVFVLRTRAVLEATVSRG